ASTEPVPSGKTGFRAASPSFLTSHFSSHFMPPLLYPSSLPSPWPTGEDVGNAETPPCRAWIPEKPLVVLGYSQDPEVELRLDAVAADGIPVYKRRGGGGAVYLDAGCVCVAWRMPRREGWGIHDYFGAGNSAVARALAA